MKKKIDSSALIEGMRKAVGLLEACVQTGDDVLNVMNAISLYRGARDIALSNGVSVNEFSSLDEKYQKAIREYQAVHEEID